jgi:hypothetical protein
MSTILIKDANGAFTTAAKADSTGQKLAADSLPVVLASDVESMTTTSRVSYREAFMTLDPARWVTVATGAGQAVTVNGTANSSRYLNIAAGTTAGSETVLLSVDTFTMPLKFSVAVSASQRIANTTFHVELVSVDSTGAVETDTTFPGTVTENATNLFGYRWTGTAVAVANYVTRGYGISEYVSSNFNFGTTAATGTTPDFIHSWMYEIVADTDQVVFTSKFVDAATTSFVGGKRTGGIPDPTKLYKIRIRCINGSTAPASSTSWRVHAISVQDDYRMSVDFSRYSGRSDLSDSLPVQVTASALAPASLRVEAVAGGLTSTFSLFSSLATTNPNSVKASAGRLYTIDCYNASATRRYLKIYNKASAPTVGTDSPVLTFVLPPNSMFIRDFSSIGLYLGTGIAFGISGGVVDTDTTAIAAADILGLNLIYA